MLSSDGFVEEQFDEWTRGLIGVTEPAIFATIVAQTLASMMSRVQLEIAKGVANGRLGSSVGVAVDSWAADFFGSDPNMMRFPNEPDAVFVDRIVSNLSPENMTLLAIATKTRAYMVLQATFGLSETFTLDTTGGLDTNGGLDDTGTTHIVPTVTAFDRQSDPTRSAVVNLQPGQTCILFSYPGLLKYGFFLGVSHLSVDSFLAPPGIQVIQAPSPALDAYVNRYVKAEGAELVYASTNTA